MTWSSAAGIQSFGDDVYEHDFKLYNDENSENLVHPFCLAEGNNFWASRDGPVLWTETFPEDASPYLDITTSDPCTQLDFSIGLFDPEVLEAQVEYETIILASAGEETIANSQFSLISEKLPLDCPFGSELPECVDLGGAGQRVSLIPKVSGCSVPGYHDWVAGVSENCRILVPVSVSSSGAAADNSAHASSISGDGNLAVFYSSARNLVDNDQNGSLSDVFIRALETGVNAIASLDSSGGGTNGHNYDGSLSFDGSRLAFSSQATDLVGGDSNSAQDVFVCATGPASCIRASVSSTGVQANGWSQAPALSADGRYVAFESIASNLVNDDTNGTVDVFVHDTLTGNTTLASRATGGVLSNGWSDGAAVSDDGSYIAFSSSASNLIPMDQNGLPDVFVHDLAAGVTTLASVNSQGVQGQLDSLEPDLSGDGRFVVFESASPNLAPEDTNTNYDIFVRDLQEGTTELISQTSQGVPANGDSYGADISSDARIIAFSTLATNLTSVATGGHENVYLREAGAVALISQSEEGVAGNGDSFNPVISPTGDTVLFDSYADNLVPGFVGSFRQVYASTIAV